MHPILSWILRLWRRSWFRPAPRPTPLPPPTAPSQAFGAVGPQATMMYFPMSAMQATMAMPWGASGMMGPAVANVVPGNDENDVSSSIDVGRGLRVEFRASATASNDQSGTHVLGRVRMFLVANSVEQIISDVSTSSPNSPATAVEWAASMIEAKLAHLKIEFDPLDMDALHAAANKAHRDSLLHCVAAFASFFVHRVDHQEVCDVWKNAEIRYVMTQ